MKKIKKIFGTPERPRLSVSRSLRYLSAQVIDDLAKRTLVNGSTRDLADSKGRLAAATELGRQLAEKAIAEGVKGVVFDRGKARYQGRIKALAEAARKAGLEF